MPLTQEFLGQMLGVRRTTVTIAARLLQSAGLIRYCRGLIQILDRRAVEEIACECYAATRTNAEKVFPPPPPDSAPQNSGSCPRNRQRVSELVGWTAAASS